MQLSHFDQATNYGGVLNPGLWPRLPSDQQQACSPTLFLGLGPILKTNLPEAGRCAVPSSGGGYGPRAHLRPPASH